MDGIRRRTRLDALGRTPLPPGIRYFSIAGIPGPERISRALRPFYDRLARVDPRNDGQTNFSGAIIPEGTLLGFVRADRWALAVPFSRDPHGLPFAAMPVEHNAFPREVLLEVIVRTVEESPCSSLLPPAEIAHRIVFGISRVCRREGRTREGASCVTSR